jgi:hypothetical protein
MAHDLIFKNNRRNWSRDKETSVSGYDPYARSLFERPNCSTQPQTLIVKQEPARIGWLGATLAVMLSTRVLSGKWPWFWGGLVAKKLNPTSQLKG